MTISNFVKKTSQNSFTEKSVILLILNDTLMSQEREMNLPLFNGVLEKIKRVWGSKEGV